MSPIYFDHAAGEPLADGVSEAMAEAASLGWANPSSVHAAGREAKRRLERAREQVAGAIGAAPADIVFTSGGTEACATGVAGLCSSAGAGLLVSSTIEHPAVQMAVESQEREGMAAVRVDPGTQSLALPGATRPLLACQTVNHETGISLPFEAWSRQVRAREGRVFLDASQALGKVSIDVSSLAVDALAIGASKVGGPAGVGALWIRRGFEFPPLIPGGGQERGRRGGTQNVIGAVGFGAACQQIERRLGFEPKVAMLRDLLEQELMERAGAVPNHRQLDRCGVISNLWFPRVDAQRLVAALDVEGLCVSAGSACSAGIAEPSPVLAALHPEQPSRASESLRFSLGPSSTKVEVESAVSIVISVLSRFET